VLIWRSDSPVEICTGSHHSCLEGVQTHLERRDLSGGESSEQQSRNAVGDVNSWDKTTRCMYGNVNMDTLENPISPVSHR
jgi:hypothetical protein